ncbi:MAG: trypsin-like peptidase domain-containing protein [Deltaproteobacteria bacterium]|nr:trypsin-like peptidase domain-containing protein [Deltaproteobacteria bacterium]
MRKTDYFCCIVLLAMLILGGWGSTVPSPERMDEARADVEQAKHLIVYVKSSKPGGGIIFHLDRDHLFIATAMHVVRMPEDDEVEIEFEFLPGHSVKAERLSFESILDLAVLRVNLNEVVNFPVDSIPVDQIGYVVGEKYVKKDDTVYPIGFPGGEKWYYPRSSSPKVIDIVGEAIQFDYMCETGDSGRTL